VEARSAQATQRVSADEILARADALRPRLREEQAATEQRARYSPEMHDEFTRAGFYRILTPRRYGGLELDVTTFYRAMMSVSRGCPSTGWMLTLGAAHSLVVASYWPQAAQDEVLGCDGEFVASMSWAFEDAVATAVDGGYLVRGTWHFASGVPYATHHMGLLPLAGEPDRTVMAIIPADRYRVLDDWGDLIGLKGSGSNSVHVDETFLPEHLVLPFGLFQDVEDGTPGYRLHGNAMYAGQFFGLALGEINAVQVGNAQAALDDYAATIATRTTMVMSGRGRRRSEDRDFQRILGLALSYTDAAYGIMVHTGDLYMEYARRGVEAGDPFSQAKTMRLYGEQMAAHKLCWEAGDMLFRASSSSGARDGTRMQRYWRDLSAFRANGLHQLDFRAHSIAQAYLGLPVTFLDAGDDE
jgi:3-hydroxy-9,10-secoandrosta-1,3,5(10)-triene-9,17-dione monooxygenase